MKKILGFVGEKLAGKDAAAEYLAKTYGAQHLRFSHILDDILRLLNLPISRRNEVDLGLGLRKVFGKSVLGPAVLKHAFTSSSEIVVINGIRMDEMDEIKKAGGKIAYITAPAELRFKRYTLRREKADDGVMDFKQFKEQEKEATEKDIPRLGAAADFKIENTGSLEDLYRNIEEIIKKIK